MAAAASALCAFVVHEMSVRFDVSESSREVNHFFPICGRRPQSSLPHYLIGSRKSANKQPATFSNWPSATRQHTQTQTLLEPINCAALIEIQCIISLIDFLICISDNKTWEIVRNM